MSGRLIDPGFKYAGAGLVSVLLTKPMYLAHVNCQSSVVSMQFRQHPIRRDVVRVVVQDTLQAADLADRPKCCAADLSDAFGDGVGSRQNLSSVVIQQR